MQQINLPALAAIRAERIDWRFKGMPDATFGSTIGEVAGQGLDLFADDFVGPLVVLDAAALEHNLRTMAGWCTAHGVALAPHGKTTMAPQLFQRQLEHGAWGDHRGERQPAAGLPGVRGEPGTAGQPAARPGRAALAGA